MSHLLWIVVLLPFLGALILGIFGAFMPKKAAGAIGVASVGLSWVAAMVLDARYLSASLERGIDTSLFQWITVGGLNTTLGLRLDHLSLVMMSVITFVSFLIHLYASQSMYDEDGYSRFFCYMNLFVGSMLTLVLADNLLFLYLGWEGVGLCSYLLIGFWYKDINNVYAAQKAFIVTRIGDTAFAIALFLLFFNFGTLGIHKILNSAPSVLAANGAIVTAIAFLLIGGAIGKSAQVPLQTWLPDAMAGPTPVSALIHAATMVTAGVYLIARMHTIFAMSTSAMLAVAIIGAFTLFYSGFSALVQRDIKRVLAYSTISQIGYMFLALGVGAWTAAIFHFMTHAFFKALLFLSAGVVIDAQHEEHDLFKLGGLKDKLPVAFWTFLIGAASLSALPLITAGFFSKDAIIWASYSSPYGNVGFLIAGLIGALVTAAYSFRALFLAFYGEQKKEVSKYPGVLMKISLIVLAFFSITVGYIGWPELILHYDPFGSFLGNIFPSLPATNLPVNRAAEVTILFVSAGLAIFGIYLAYAYYKHNRWAEVVERSPVAQTVHAFFFSGWGFDWFYERIFVRPFKAIAYGNRDDFIDYIYKGMAETARYVNLALSASQNGRVRSYAAGIVIGAIIIAVIALLR